MRWWSSPGSSRNAIARAARFRSAKAGGERYGVRAWELDNEPESYRTNWKGQAADYAEFVTRAAERIKAADPQAVIVAPGMAGGKHGLSWLEATLDAAAMQGSPEFRTHGKPYSIGPVIDVVSLHNYEFSRSYNRGGNDDGGAEGVTNLLGHAW